MTRFFLTEWTFELDLKINDHFFEGDNIYVRHSQNNVILKSRMVVSLSSPSPHPVPAPPPDVGEEEACVTGRLAINGVCSTDALTINRNS